MKIAVISDIHGNKEALDSVLSDIKLCGARKIFCLGDIAMGGYLPNYTIEKLIELKNSMNDDFKIIQGNTDKLIVEYSDSLFERMSLKNPLMAQALKCDMGELKKENIDFLADLPVNLYIEISGVKIQLVHGSPNRQDENIYPDFLPDTVENMVKDSLADVILCGHTHLPAGYSLNSGKTVVNAGSVGRSMTKDKMSVYLIMDIDEFGNYSFEHRIVKYDNKKVSEIIRKRNFALADEFSKLYI